MLNLIYLHLSKLPLRHNEHNERKLQGSDEKTDWSSTTLCYFAASLHATLRYSSRYRCRRTRCSPLASLVVG